MIRIVFASLLAFATLPIATAQPSVQRWYKGNTHTHTKNSDGDSLPTDVVKWYADHKYNFLFMTDHEFLTPIAPLNEQFSKAGEFVVMQGQEVTDSFNKKPQHLNALGVSRVCMPARSTVSSAANIQANVDCIRSAGGVPQLNHPNFGWALTAAEILKVNNLGLMEIHNGHPMVNNLGGAGSPGAEEIWDTLLTAGMRIYGIADDDSHAFKQLNENHLANPGRGWIFVRSPELTQAAILAAIERGDFYASTGVELADLSYDGKTLMVDIKEQSWSKYTINFIGRGGRVLKTATAEPTSYKVTGREGYVRVKITESNGKMAWTQPIIVAKK
ncbi:MAG: CehA/McbA family metallohydrolase [Pyrinomonadaceae bacterium]